METVPSRLSGLASRARQRPAVTMRALALSFGLLLIGTSVSVFYHLVDVAGGVPWFAAGVAGAFVLGTGFARRVSARTTLVLASVLLVGGASVYIVLTPEHHDRVFTVGFLFGFLRYLTGISVLQFVSVDVWAIAVSPGPVFLTWYLLLRRRYDLAALVGGLTLGFFVLTGDAGWTTTLLGTVSVLGVLGFGAIEHREEAWGAAERLGGVLVGSVLLAQVLRGIDGRSDGEAGPGSGGGASTLESSFVEADERVRIFGRIALSPLVRFTVTADEPALWHAASYDRYTGGNWVRSRESTAYEGPQDPPPGPTRTLGQTFHAERAVRSMPAAWKPVRLPGSQGERTRVTSTGGLEPTRPLRAGEEYTVVSRVSTASPARLRATGTYPRQVRERYTQLPASTPSRLRRRATEITADAATAYDAARAIERWLETNKAYSLDIRRPDGDVADAFVFGMDAGYCVYFATAMTVMLRTLGIPARFAHGYTPGQRVADDRWVVRGLDAHAWTEVYFAGVGWVAFDPTPTDPRRAAEQARIEQARAEGVAGVDTDETRPETDTPTPGPTPEVNASRNVTAPATQTNTPRLPTDATGLDGTRTPSTTPGAPPVSGVVDTGEFVERLETAASGVDRLTLLATVAGVVLGVHRFDLLKRGYRAFWLRYQPTTDSPSRDVERAFARLEYALGRRHRPRASDETPRQYVDALGPGVDRRALRVLHIYERTRYAGVTSRREADEAVRLVNELVAEGTT